eukprot:CAMPEP_0168508346 /NCGR_PEP_ID=MMETSP0405-20121227/63_1 /TAXON_ID=498012 /ORGANISM="Trichosphaerium sp, Strain Am-I-7 wt" /LENGTH=200 /DNA_ID=CAMNT_0008525471 /DNA_START=711 /DNA_END=1313 /DNA_ORIENTATION=-
MARAAGGKAEFISNTRNLKEKVVAHLEAALSPAMININVDWGELSITQQAPMVISSLYSNSRLLVYALLPMASTEDLNTIITLNGSTVDEKKTRTVTFKIPVTNTPHLKGNLIHTLAAKSLITELLEADDSGENDTLALNDFRSREEFIKKSVTNLALKYSLISKFTSFVASGIDLPKGKQRTMRRARKKRVYSGMDYEL